MKKCRFLFYTIIFSIVTTTALSQGCSDAGFCTMGAMKPDQPYNKKINLRLRSMELSFYRGTTPISPVIYVATADLNFGINAKTFFQLKLPYQAITGNFGKTSGMSDISLCLTRNVHSSEAFDVNLSLGAKIPTNDSDLTSDDPRFEGLPLPMYYQTSLGTYDAIFGISIINRKWLFATGVQHALNKNNNQFSWGPWFDPYPDDDYLRKNAAAIELKRGTDVMLRVERNFRFSRLNFTLGLLPIYRLNKDEIRNSEGNRVKVVDAQGLALSGIFTTGYNFNVRTGIKLLVGHKIVQRKVNPDGLTRELVSTFRYYYRF